MKKNNVPSGLALCLFSTLCIHSALYAVGEKTLSVGAAAGWKSVGARSSIAELNGARPFPVLTLSSAVSPPLSCDFYLSFDEGNPERFKDSMGNYSVAAGQGVRSTEKHWARKGAGAAFFPGVETVSYKYSNERLIDPLVLIPSNPKALFAPYRNLGDFTIEFFLYPVNMESGEEILEWEASLRRNADTKNNTQLQNIRVVVAKNRLNWTFNNFFISPDGAEGKPISLSAQSPQTPGRWSHHLVRFDAGTGLVEYLVDSVIQAAAFATVNGREGGEVWPPVAGERGSFSIGRQFSGFIDELKLSGMFSDEEDTGRYSSKGGQIETEPLDLGGQSSIRKVDISGGMVRLSGQAMANEYRRGGNFRFDGDAQLQFFIRSADSRYGLAGVKYTPFKSGESLFTVNGRFAQVLVDFYPSGDKETAPYIEEIKLEYLPKTILKAPSALTAKAYDGVVELSWKDTGENAAGYFVYYGTNSGEYFGDGAGQGASPINVGKTTSVRLDSLQNGVLYYFTVASYDNSEHQRFGNLSKEVSARPLRMLE